MPNKTAELVLEWADFEARHPDADIADFCRFRLIQDREKQKDAGFLGGIIPPTEYAVLAKLIGRISMLLIHYSEAALRECGVRSLTEFLFLNSIGQSGPMRKTAVIQQNFSELSTGLLCLDRLKRKGWVSERSDPSDGRSKLLTLLPKGKDKLQKCYGQMRKATALFFGHLSEEDVRLCIQLLSPVDMRFAPLWPEHKDLSYSEIEERLRPAAFAAAGRGRKGYQ